jgi:hypothetical protein
LGGVLLLEFGAIAAPAEVTDIVLLAAVELARVVPPRRRPSSPAAELAGLFIAARASAVAMVRAPLSG